ADTMAAECAVVFLVVSALFCGNFQAEGRSLRPRGGDHSRLGVRLVSGGLRHARSERGEGGASSSRASVVGGGGGVRVVRQTDHFQPGAYNPFRAYPRRRVRRRDHREDICTPGHSEKVRAVTKPPREEASRVGCCRPDLGAPFHWFPIVVRLALV